MGKMWGLNLCNTNLNSNIVCGGQELQNYAKKGTSGDAPNTGL